MKPKNFKSTFGILAQVANEKDGSFKPYYDFNKLKKELNLALGHPLSLKTFAIFVMPMWGNEGVKKIVSQAANGFSSILRSRN